MNSQTSDIGSLRVARLTGDDIIGRSDNLLRFEEYVLETQGMYPSIDKWVKTKVCPGIRSSERMGFVGLLGNKPVASAVVRRGRNAKFCHLRIDKAFRNNNLGELFFCLMAMEARREAEEIHFTLPESLWAEKAPFFQSFGFKSVKLAETQYRLFETELRCSASFEVVWQAVMDRLPRLFLNIMNREGENPNVLSLSVKPEYAEHILDGTKKVELRRKFSKKWKGVRMSIYASAPRQAFVGEAKIQEVVSGSPVEIWSRFHDQVGVTRREFDAYTADTEEICALVLSDVFRYKGEVYLSQMPVYFPGELRPPQSYCMVQNHSNWSRAVSLASLMQRTFSYYLPPGHWAEVKGNTSGRKGYKSEVQKPDLWTHIGVEGGVLTACGK